LTTGRNKEKVRTLFFSSVQFNLFLAEKCSGPLRFRLRQCSLIKRKLALAENFSGPLRFHLRQVLLYYENFAELGKLCGYESRIGDLYAVR
jgi:hypothetical protein